MATSQIVICNLALNALGCKSIASLSDSSQEAIQLNLVYDTCRDAVLRAADWNFATFHATLAAISGDTELAHGWDYIYAYPVTCLKIRMVYADTETQHPEASDFIECLSSLTAAKGIACQITPAYIKYTYKVTDPTKHDPMFDEALAMKLAATVCVKLTGDSTKRDKMMSLYEIALSEAMKSNSIEKENTPEKTSDTLDARG